MTLIDIINALLLELKGDQSQNKYFLVLTYLQAKLSLEKNTKPNMLREEFLAKEMEATHFLVFQDIYNAIRHHPKLVGRGKSSVMCELFALFHQIFSDKGPTNNLPMRYFLLIMVVQSDLTSLTLDQKKFFIERILKNLRLTETALGWFNSLDAMKAGDFIATLKFKELEENEIANTLTFCDDLISLPIKKWGPTVKESITLLSETLLEIHCRQSEKKNPKNEEEDGEESDVEFEFESGESGFDGEEEGEDNDSEESSDDIDLTLPSELLPYPEIEKALAVLEEKNNTYFDFITILRTVINGQETLESFFEEFSSTGEGRTRISEILDTIRKMKQSSEEEDVVDQKNCADKGSVLLFLDKCFELLLDNQDSILEAELWSPELLNHIVFILQNYINSNVKSEQLEQSTDPLLSVLGFSENDFKWLSWLLHCSYRKTECAKEEGALFTFEYEEKALLFLSALLENLPTENASLRQQVLQANIKHAQQKIMVKVPVLKEIVEEVQGKKLLEKQEDKSYLERFKKGIDGNFQVVEKASHSVLGVCELYNRINSYPDDLRTKADRLLEFFELAFKIAQPLESYCPEGYFLLVLLQQKICLSEDARLNLRNRILTHYAFPEIFRNWLDAVDAQKTEGFLLNLSKVTLSDLLELKRFSFLLLFTRRDLWPEGNLKKNFIALLNRITVVTKEHKEEDMAKQEKVLPETRKKEEIEEEPGFSMGRDFTEYRPEPNFIKSRGDSMFDYPFQDYQVQPAMQSLNLEEHVKKMWALVVEQKLPMVALVNLEEVMSHPLFSSQIEGLDRTIREKLDFIVKKLLHDKIDDIAVSLSNQQNFALLNYFGQVFPLKEDRILELFKIVSKEEDQERIKKREHLADARKNLVKMMDRPLFAFQVQHLEMNDRQSLDTFVRYLLKDYYKLHRVVTSFLKKNKFALIEYLAQTLPREQKLQMVNILIQKGRTKAFGYIPSLHKIIAGDIKDEFVIKDENRHYFLLDDSEDTLLEVLGCTKEEFAEVLLSYQNLVVDRILPKIVLKIIEDLKKGTVEGNDTGHESGVASVNNGSMQIHLFKNRTISLQESSVIPKDIGSQIVSIYNNFSETELEKNLTDFCQQEEIKAILFKHYIQQVEKGSVPIQPYLIRAYGSLIGKDIPVFVTDSKRDSVSKEEPEKGKEIQKLSEAEYAIVFDTEANKMSPALFMAEYALNLMCKNATDSDIDSGNPRIDLILDNNVIKFRYTNKDGKMMQDWKKLTFAEKKIFKAIENILTSREGVLDGYKQPELKKYIGKIIEKAISGNIDPKVWLKDTLIDKIIKTHIKYLYGGFEEGCDFLLKREMKHPVDENTYRQVYCPPIGDGTNEGNMPIDYYFNKNTQSMEKSEADSRRDVFDEIGPIMKEKENCHFLIRIPYNVNANHWNELVVTISKVKNNLDVCFYCYDHKAGKIDLDPVSAFILEVAIKTRIGRYLKLRKVKFKSTTYEEMIEPLRQYLKLIEKKRIKVKFKRTTEDIIEALRQYLKLTYKDIIVPSKEDLKLSVLQLSEVNFKSSSKIKILETVSSKVEEEEIEEDGELPYDWDPKFVKTQEVVGENEKSFEEKEANFFDILEEHLDKPYLKLSEVNFKRTTYKGIIEPSQQYGDDVFCGRNISWIIVNKFGGNLSLKIYPRYGYTPTSRLIKRTKKLLIENDEKHGTKDAGRIDESVNFNGRTIFGLIRSASKRSSKIKILETVSSKVEEEEIEEDGELPYDWDPKFVKTQKVVEENEKSSSSSNLFPFEEKEANFFDILDEHLNKPLEEDEESSSSSNSSQSEQEQEEEEDEINKGKDDVDFFGALMEHLNIPLQEPKKSYINFVFRKSNLRHELVEKSRFFARKIGKEQGYMVLACRLHKTDIFKLNCAFTSASTTDPNTVYSSETDAINATADLLPECIDSEEFIYFTVEFDAPASQVRDMVQRGLFEELLRDIKNQTKAPNTPMLSDELDRDDKFRNN